jgi:hypothetical protein
LCVSTVPVDIHIGTAGIVYHWSRQPRFNYDLQKRIDLICTSCCEYRSHRPCLQSLSIQRPKEVDFSHQTRLICRQLTQSRSHTPMNLRTPMHTTRRIKTTTNTSAPTGCRAFRRHSTGRLPSRSMNSFRQDRPYIVSLTRMTLLTASRTRTMTLTNRS